ncbi:catechol-2,3-dioxygenase [Arthrobacter sp. CAN_A6]|uniref:VOC family protein n=1 Tax=Arthrobacter sp. CAN_A6 TaxID=2787721 RepID=UPI0018C8F96A
MPSFTGIDHLALTVSDLAVSVPFYSRLWNTEPAATMDDGPFFRQVFVLPGGMTLGLTQHDHGSGKPFDGKSPGLDHIGFTVVNRAELEAWAKLLDIQDISHSGLVEASYGTALSFKDPDGIALEFFVNA